jgi:cobalt transporter subunit CbtA
MLRRIFLTALIAGIAAGLFAAGFQRLRIIPLIAAAETYEAATEHNHANASDHRHDATAEWEPAPGIERSAYTIVADILAGIGFALMLTGAIALSRLGGYRIDAGRGLLWGAAGFLVFALAPASALPPELPGMAAAALYERQTWWLLTATATAVGLGLFVFGARSAFRAAGVVIFALPHLVGGPPTGHGAAAIPAELAASFVSASLTAAALFWLFLGGLSGWLYRRFEA